MTPIELYNHITTCLHKKKPVSVVRAGDGESIILNGYADTQKLEWVFKRQLGYMPEPNQVKEIQNHLIEAYKDADYIGVPENKREGLNDYWYKCLEILESNIGDLNNKKLTSVDFHNDWLTAGYLDNLLSGIGTLIYISCRDLDARFMDKYAIENVHSFRIAPEMKFTPDYKGPQHYPTQFNQIKIWMDSIAVKGNLCLVGGGVVGKVYCKWFKDRGGIALDIGNVFDLLYGLATRGKLRGVGVKNEMYKI